MSVVGQADAVVLKIGSWAGVEREEREGQVTAL